MSARILLVEDEPGLVLTLCDRLRAEGYDVTAESNGVDGLQRVTRERFDLLILDVMLPGMSGFDVCRELRRRSVPTPVLMLTARDEITDRVVGFKLGADDYLTKPFEMAELLARVEARLRRPALPSACEPDQVEFGDVRVDLRRGEVRRGGELVDLSAKEYQLLRYFVMHRDVLLSRRQLLEEVWGLRGSISTRTVDVHVAGLRRKLESHPHQPQLFLTHHGLGYRFAG